MSLENRVCQVSRSNSTYSHTHGCPRGHFKALHIRTTEKCKDKATHANGLFCWLHSTEAYALYMGYKRRNARLNSFDEEAPPYLTQAKVSLANQNFQDIKDQKTIDEVHSHLFKKYTLLGQVIDARRVHHKHFYPVHYDYGHQAYLDKLSNERHIVLRALEKVAMRLSHILYQKEQWFAWVKQVQDEEEATREREQKKVKQEAVLFKRHWKELQARMDQKRNKDDERRQDAFLEEAWRERVAEEKDLDAFDPIQDADYHKRLQYVELIKHFLWMEPDVRGVEKKDTSSALPSKVEALDLSNESLPPSKKPENKSKGKMTGGASKAGDTKAQSSKAAGPHGQNKLLAMQENGETGADFEGVEPKKSAIETEEEVRKRLGEGVKKNYDDAPGFTIIGTLENPHELKEKTAPMAVDEVDQAVKDIRQIKLLLFCRLLLAQASMLPAAVRASNVQEFLDDVEVAESDLRDLCLRVEQPTLQDIRDACADFARGNEAASEEDEGADEDYEICSDSDDDANETLQDMLADDARFKHFETEDLFANKLLGKVSKFGKHNQKYKAGKTGTKSQKTKITIYGKTIWNYASEKAMSRDGWLQFSIMAKDCDLKDAIQLCRNWNEFSDLSHLTNLQFFPAANWISWGAERTVSQLQELEFFPYFFDFEAQGRNRHHQVGGRGHGRRQHEFVEMRNIMVGHMKRHHPVTRRFLQYLMMRTGRSLAPDQLWTFRAKKGLGRASKNEWVNILEVGPAYFAMTDKLRKWRFGFNDYYDVFIWDFAPGTDSMETYNLIITELRNAWRIKQPRDVYQHKQALLRTLTREKETMRVRQIKPGENVSSLWGDVTSPSVEFRLFDVNMKSHDVRTRTDADFVRSPYLFYNEASAAEDRVLFPDELVSNKESVPFRELKNGISRLDSGSLDSRLKIIARGMEALDIGEDPFRATENIMDNEKDSIWALPKVWDTGLKQLRKDQPTIQEKTLLQRVGLLRPHKSLSLADRLEFSDRQEVMERDRSIGFKSSFHQGDLEPGSNDRWQEVEEKIKTMLNNTHVGSTKWILFLAEILAWLKLRADYKEYNEDPHAPWPHGFIAQDLVSAFSKVAMFFPNSETTHLVTMFIKFDTFKESLLDKFRPDKFWKDWEAHSKGPGYWVDTYPMDWSLAVRPIIAHLYRAGVIAPAYMQPDPQICPGVVVASTEPHRPDKLDLFIRYDSSDGFIFPPNFLAPDNWPAILPLARAYASFHLKARFSLLRLWSAAHFYPLMVGLGNRLACSFIDSAGRAWEWKFMAKDMPGSELSVHHTTGRRIEMLREQFGDKVMHRGDLIFVMGEDEEDLLKYTVAATFAIQTKPWLREVDLWESFINVDLSLMEGLNPFWLD
ncbi:hypothetical protein B0I35DRAFT_484412 [Stachybotrys elegans]|uniref:Mfs allantoate protein n=1 Tax=Stachybotrys elegans TaxID=80388 RepID=A0A8K0SEY5_9HYPO|nr:hypothetical protein B0I35DRAFT_484412 [Stachybotrys elegans]